MRVILDNIIFSLQKAGGISGAWAKLIEQLLQRPELELKFVERENARHNIYRAMLDIPAYQIIQQKHLPLLVDRYMPVSIREDAPFVFHSSYYRYCRLHEALNVVTLHDFIYEEAGTHSRTARIIHSQQKRAALIHANAIAAVSNYTASKLHKFYPAIGNNRHICVIGNPAVCTPSSDTDTHITSQLISTPYLLYVGGRATYKKFLTALRVSKAAGMPLVIAGAPLGKKEISDARLISTDYIEKIYPSPQRLSLLYRNAHALLYLSANEGFGIPIIEAQTHGCPVIIGECEACREVAGNGALMARAPHTVEEAVLYIKKIENSLFRHQLIENGYCNIQRYSSKQIADDYINLYHRLLSKH